MKTMMNSSNRLRSLLLAIFGMTSLCSAAQETASGGNSLLPPYAKSITLNASVGSNIDLARSTDNSLGLALGTRKSSATMFNIRFSNLFARRWGYYLDTRLKFFEYEVPTSNISIGEALEKVFSHLLGAGWLGKVHGDFHTGFLYRLENERWKFHPNLGIGVSIIGRPGESSKQINGEKRKTRSENLVYSIEPGITLHYQLSQKVSLLLDASYQQPLNSVKVTSIHTTSDGVTQKNVFKDSTFGREANISLGIGIWL